MKSKKAGIAQACSCCTSVVCMAQMGTTAVAGGASMGVMGAATSSSVPLLTVAFQAAGLGFLLALPASFYQILLVVVLGFTMISSYFSYTFHKNPGPFGLVVFSSILLYSSIYLLMSESLYWTAFVLMLLSAAWSYKTVKRKSDIAPHAKPINQVGTYIVFLAILIIIAIAGYVSFLAFAQNMAVLGALPLITVAVFAGLATFFSPCSFGLLPAYLSLYGKGEQNHKGTIFKNGISASAGLITFNILLGIIIALIGLGIGSAFSIAAGGRLAGITLTVRAIIGGILVVLGVMQFFHISIQGKLFKGVSQKFASGKKGYSNYFFYGFGYNLGNVGCTGPIMAGLIILALASGFNVALLAFVVYSLTMAVLMLAVSLLVGSAKISFLQESSHKIMRLSAIVLVLAGLFILGTVVFAQQFAGLFFP